MYQQNIYESVTDDKIKQIEAFSKDYKNFLSVSKTERLAVNEIKQMAILSGYKSIDKMKELHSGDKYFFENRGKNIALFCIGKSNLLSGIKILEAHLDSPRLDLKPGFSD